MEIKAEAKNKGYLYWALSALTLLVTLFPGISRASALMEDSARLVLVLIQIGTLFTAMLCFQRIFAEAETKLPVYFGVLLYMTCPYRIYVCYESAELSEAAAWLLLPLCIWAFVGITRCRNLKNLAAAVFALAAVIGLGLFMFEDIYYDIGFTVKSIMGDGYRFGEYFQSFDCKEGHPGMGLGMLICLLTGAWMAFVKGVKEEHRICKFFALAAGVLTVLSFYLFPWDMVQRLGDWALIFVSVMGTPAIFWGMALVCLCVPAACAMDRISRDENKLVAVGVPVTVIMACLGVCAYQCSRL